MEPFHTSRPTRCRPAHRSTTATGHEQHAATPRRRRPAPRRIPTTRSTANSRRVGATRPTACAASPSTPSATKNHPSATAIVRTSDNRRTAPGTCGSVNGLKSRPSRDRRRSIAPTSVPGAYRITRSDVTWSGGIERVQRRRRHRGTGVERAAVAGARRHDDRARHLHHPHRARLVVVVALHADRLADARVRGRAASARRARSRRPGAAAGRGGARRRSARTAARTPRRRCHVLRPGSSRSRTRRPPRRRGSRRASARCPPATCPR